MTPVAIPVAMLIHHVHPAWEALPGQIAGVGYWAGSTMCWAGGWVREKADDKRCALASPARGAVAAVLAGRTVGQALALARSATPMVDAAEEDSFAPGDGD